MRNPIIALTLATAITASIATSRPPFVSAVLVNDTDSRTITVDVLQLEEDLPCELLEAFPEVGRIPEITFSRALDVKKKSPTPLVWDGHCALVEMEEGRRFLISPGLESTFEYEEADHGIRLTADGAQPFGGVVELTDTPQPCERERVSWTWAGEALEQTVILTDVEVQDGCEILYFGEDVFEACFVPELGFVPGEELTLEHTASGIALTSATMRVTLEQAPSLIPDPDSGQVETNGVPAERCVLLDGEAASVFVGARRFDEHFVEGEDLVESDDIELILVEALSGLDGVDAITTLRREYL